MVITSLAQLKNLSQNISPTKLTLLIKTSHPDLGITLIELLTALEILRHSPQLTLTHLTTSNPNSYEFSQALFQTRYYFPNVEVQ